MLGVRSRLVDRLDCCARDHSALGVSNRPLDGSAVLRHDRDGQQRNHQQTKDPEFQGKRIQAALLVGSVEVCGPGNRVKRIPAHA